MNFHHCLLKSQLANSAPNILARGHNGLQYAVFPREKDILRGHIP
jgi:hypothetical protein